MNRIYVFSGTGTSLQVARDIAKELGDTEVLSIPKLMRKNEWSIEGDKVGIIFPCYYGETPDIVEEFIDNATSISSSYFFSIVTAGNDNGYSLNNLSKHLSARGQTLNYGNQVIVASNYMNGWYYNMLMPSKKSLDKRVARAHTLSKNIAKDVKANTESVIKSKYLNYIMPQLISPTKYIDNTKPWDSDFSITSECTKCGICAKVCPVKNIDVTDTGHIFSHTCLRCMACVQYCPKAAFTICNKAMNKPKYTHPDISFTDISNFNNQTSESHNNK